MSMLNSHLQTSYHRHYQIHRNNLVQKIRLLTDDDRKIQSHLQLLDALDKLNPYHVG
ncbi:unnamed protein product [Schistosoma mattheei]|uniref:Uncharacterized protein n=1 Tax=Schistosoma mattheei TaxID=31246 RepID=A0A183PQN9_9TREM|nr:unnamed protein product [Schistosoma mattheei]